MAMPTGEAILARLKKNKVTHAVTVPDWIQIGLHQALSADGDIDVVPFCTEDEAITAGAGLHIGGKRPVVIIQNQGLYAGLNALRAIGLDAGMPLVLFIGQFGREIAHFTPDPAQSARRVVRILEPVLDAVEVPHWRVEDRSDLGVIDAAFETAFRDGWPSAVIFGQNLPLEA
ncbi:thiamine pyrophosphate-binding protein [Rhodophyticola sp. CCM32]|uniref:thiamine pyrophosphate-binding protein n=1 Tax=Rhodophyticola sp. CCM32 TaxID=2916397 RepID=UPI00107F6D0D|nr:thiamine pyrophosphate-binding protein [Rhodophyticola sp. CCM32]QBX99787.1 thiamine pyrophosphate-binding protein [Rhodophyticola sp. CCM32]